jgi:hypothetical protein
VLTILAELLQGSAWRVEATDFGAPYGVGYHLGLWGR